MHIAEALVALGGAFLVCGLIARAGVRIGLPTIPLFMIAGVIFGPNTPGIALVEDPAELELVARLGLIFLLFYLGLEFSLDQLTSGGALAFGFALGWGTREALVIAGVVGISSSAIVTKLLVELRRLGNPETRVILGIIVIEDVFLALYLALLQPVLATAAPQPPTRLQEGDVLLVFTAPEHRLATEQRIRAVHRSGRMARWRGDTGR